MTDDSAGWNERTVTDQGAGSSDEDSPAVIYPLVADRGNERVLTEWLERSAQYTIADTDRSLEHAAFDLCIVDADGLRAHRTRLADVKAAYAPELLPVLLLLSDDPSAVIDLDEGAIADSVFAITVDEILSMPIRQAELTWRIKALLRLRDQSIELSNRAAALNRFRKAVDASGHPIFITDPDGTIEYVNTAFEDTTGYSAAVAIGNTPSLLKSAEMSSEFYAELWSTITAGEIWEAEITNRRSDGVTYTARQTIAPITDPDGEIRAYVAIQTDITDLKNRTRQLKVIDTILRHNLRNNLTTIRGNAELIAEESSGTIAEWADDIVSDADDLLSTGQKSRLITETLSEDPELTDLNVSSVVSWAIDAVSATHPNAQFETDLADDLETTVTIEFQEAIEELLTNAVLHTDEDTAEISVRGWADAESVKISVRDNGPGISAMNAEVLESGSAPDDLHHGSGLGLWLVYWIVTRSGGDIDVETGGPEGTCITLSLPNNPLEDSAEH